MIVCYVAPVLRAVRRVAVARPRVAAPAAVAGAVVRRAPRPLLVCRDVGVLGLAGAVGGSGPAAAPTPAAGTPAPPMAAEGGGPSAGTPTPGPGLGGGFAATLPNTPPGSFTPPGLPPGLLFPPGAPPLPDGPGDDWTTVVVRVPEVPEPVNVPEPSALSLLALALLAGAFLLRRRAATAQG